MPEDNGFKLFGDECLLSYKPSIIKIIVSTVIIAYTVASLAFPKNIPQLPTLINSLLFIISLFTLLSSIGEIAATHDNRKWFALTKADINTIAFQSIASDELYDMFMANQQISCIVKCNGMIIRICAEYWVRRHPIYTKHYYIDEIEGKKIQRYRYDDFGSFVQVLNKAKGNRDVFDVIYWDGLTANLFARTGNGLSQSNSRRNKR